MGKLKNENMDIRYTKFGWIDFSNMVKTKDNRIDWKNSIGHQISFRYQNVVDKIIVKKWIDGDHVLIDIPKYASNKKVTTSSLIANKLGGHLDIRMMDYKYEIGDVVNGYIILEQTHKSKGKYKEKAYICKCIVDGYINIFTEDKLKISQGCPVCKNKVVMRGVNDVATTNPELIAYFADINDAYSHTLFSNKKVQLKCQKCGTEKTYSLNDFMCKGFSCPQCGDKLSYGSKYVFSLLKQLFQVEDIKSEHRFNWSLCVPTSFKPDGKSMQYDFYIPMFNMIIEVHGIQHYEECGLTKFVSLEDNQENDRVKRQVAIDNGIYYYIELDCRKSDPDYIKNSIMNSELPNVLDFCEHDINWFKCNHYATSSIVFETAKLWNEGDRSPKHIGIQFGLDRNTIARYLKRANSLNLLTTPYPLPKQSKSTQPTSHIS